MLIVKKYETDISSEERQDKIKEYFAEVVNYYVLIVDV